MKKWTYLLGLCMFFTLFSSCNGEEVYFAPDSMSYANVQNYSLNLDSTQDEIVDVPISPNRRNGISTYSVNENSSFLGIREMEVNIIVRENTHNSNMRYLTSNGVQKELSVRAQDTKSDKQKFKLYIMPLTGYVYIKDYQGHLVSMGVYKNNPNTRILYVKDGDSTSGICWDFLRGEQRSFSNILMNADAVEQGTGGWTDMYNEVLGVKDSKLYFGKYSNSATQEFEIRVLEELKIVGQPTYELANVNPEEKPDYILRGTVRNNGNTSAQMSIQYSEGAKVSSSFQESQSYTTNISANTGVSTPVFSLGGSVSSSSTYGFTYNSGSEKNVSYLFVQTVTVEPHTTVQVTAVVKNYKVACDYSTLVEGTKSGRQFKIYGRWEGISCADVDYEINVLNSSGQLVKSLKTKGKLNEPLKF